MPDNWNKDINELKMIIDSIQSNTQPWIRRGADMKYISIRIDTRDGAFLLFDRENNPITVEHVIGKKCTQCGEFKLTTRLTDCGGGLTLNICKDCKC